MPKSNYDAVIIGAGIGGLATAALLAKAGKKVVIVEKNHQSGGRAGVFTHKGFTFDTGPSWYLMPEVFEQFFELLGEDISSHLNLQKLSPAYTVFFEDQSVPTVTIYGEEKRDRKTFENLEKGAGEALGKYLDRAEDTYAKAVGNFLHTNFAHPKSFLNRHVMGAAPRIAPYAVRSIQSYISGYVKHPALQQILAYPMVFLGTSPFDAPALYHLMSYMDFRQGVYYPQGGMYTIIEALEKIAKQNGVTILLNQPVEKILYREGEATGVKLSSGREVIAPLVISNADLHHTETKLLPPAMQTYPETYWRKKVAGPGAVLMYLGVKGKLPHLSHHNLFFTKDWKKNFESIFKDKTWPYPASFYVSMPSATDPSIAPKGHENLFVLVPVAAETDYSPKELEERANSYLKLVADSLQIPDLEERLVYKKVVGPDHFMSYLNSWQGTALGMAHTLSQSALWRPRNKSKKLKGLYYVGGNTVPGIGLPMCLISAQNIYKRLTNDHSNSPLVSLQPLPIISSRPSRRRRS